MKTAWLMLALVLPAAADRVEGTLVQVQSESPTRVVLCLKNGDQTEAVEAEASRCGELFARGLGQRWAIFANRSPQGILNMTSASNLGPDPVTGGAFDLIKRQIHLINQENWSQALSNFGSDGRPPLSCFSEQWRGTLLSEQPADWQVLCSNANRVTMMVGGTHAKGYNSPRYATTRRSTCNLDCQMQGGRWVVTSMNP